MLNGSRSAEIKTKKQQPSHLVGCEWNPELDEMTKRTNIFVHGMKATDHVLLRLAADGLTFLSTTAPARSLKQVIACRATDPMVRATRRRFSGRGPAAAVGPFHGCRVRRGGRTTEAIQRNRIRLKRREQMSDCGRTRCCCSNAERGDAKRDH